MTKERCDDLEHRSDSTAQFEGYQVASVDQRSCGILIAHRPSYRMKLTRKCASEASDGHFAANTNSYRGKAELIIGKQRNGPTGVVNLTFIDSCTRFEAAAFGE